MSMNMSISNNPQSSKDLELKLYLHIEETPSFQAYTGSENTSITYVDLFASTEEDARRFHKAWEELSKL